MLFVLSIPSSILTEYGTQAFIMAVFGYLVRHKDNLPYDNRDTLSYYLVFSVFSYIVGAQLGFMFGQTQLIFLVIGLIAVHFYLLGFENRTYPQISQKIGMPLRRIIQFGGRRTLEIYFAHVILFRIIAHFINPHMYSYTGINLIDLAPGEDFPDILEAGKGPIDK